MPYRANGGQKNGPVLILSRQWEVTTDVEAVATVPAEWALFSQHVMANVL